MFYGNFEEMKYIYASKAIPELLEYMSKIKELKNMKNSMTSTFAAKGISSLNEMLQKTKKTDYELTKIKALLLEKIPQLEEFKITEEDIENLYNQS